MLSDAPVCEVKLLKSGGPFTFSVLEGQQEEEDVVDKAKAKDKAKDTRSFLNKFAEDGRTSVMKLVGKFE